MYNCEERDDVCEEMDLDVRSHVLGVVTSRLRSDLEDDSAVEAFSTSALASVMSSAGFAVDPDFSSREPMRSLSDPEELKMSPPTMMDIPRPTCSKCCNSCPEVGSMCSTSSLSQRVSIDAGLPSQKLNKLTSQ